MSSKQVLRWLSMLTVVLMLAACSSSPSSTSNPSTVQREKHARLAIISTPQSYDPHKGAGGTEHQVLYGVFDLLIRHDASGKLIPGLAESWEWPNLTTLVLNLRKGVKFHDGTTFNAEAVKFNFDRIMDPKEQSLVRGEFDTVASVEITGEYQVTLRFKEPNVAFPAVLSDRSGMIVSPESAKKLGAEFGRKPVGAGPFTFKEWVDGSHVTLVKNPDFWEKGLPKLDKVTFFTFKDDEAAVRGLKSGDIDFMQNLPAREHTWAKGTTDFTFIQSPHIGQNQFVLNKLKPPMDDVNFRRAVQHAIDREALLRVAYGGSGSLSPSLYPMGFWTVDPNLKMTPYDPNRAKQLLQQSSWKGEKVSFAVQNDDRSMRVAQMIQQFLKEVGVESDILPLPQAERTARYTVKGEFHGRIGGWSGRPDPHVNYFSQIGCGGGFNAPTEVGGHCDPEVTRLLDKGRSTTDENARRAAYYELDRYFIDQVLMIPLVFNSWDAVVRTNITGFEAYLFGKPFVIYWDMK